MHKHKEERGKGLAKAWPCTMIYFQAFSHVDPGSLCGMYELWVCIKLLLRIYYPGSGGGRAVFQWG
jgi:hypothetical protein